MAKNMTELLDMQRQLMEEVPHDLRQEVYPDVMCVKDIIEKSLLFLASLGHKPWRPNPLPAEVQQARLEALSHSLDVLLITHGRDLVSSPKGEEYEKWTRKLISAFGVRKSSVLVVELLIDYYSLHHNLPLSL